MGCPYFFKPATGNADPFSKEFSMHGRMPLFFILSFLASACSSNSLLRPDCHSCTVEEQSWKDFDFASLHGQWKGVVETATNNPAAKKKEQKETRVDLRFLPAEKFAAAQGLKACALPAGGVVLNGVLWEGNAAAGAKEFDAFVPVDGGKVAYGRVTVRKGDAGCEFRRMGRLMGRNRLSLPAVAFSDSAAFPGRQVASGDLQQEVNVEFLRFVPAQAKKIAFAAEARKPASAFEQERPPLMIRVVRIFTAAGGERGQWKGAEEQLFRLWRAE